jgi:hypothetical protein
MLLKANKFQSTAVSPLLEDRPTRVLHWPTVPVSPWDAQYRTALLSFVKNGSRAMRLLAYPNNQDVFWVVFGWAVLYGVVRALLTDGSNGSTQTFDDSAWPLAILFGWPALYWLISHGLFAL